MKGDKELQAEEMGHEGVSQLEGVSMFEIFSKHLVLIDSLVIYGEGV